MRPNGRPTTPRSAGGNPGDRDSGERVADANDRDFSASRVDLRSISAAHRRADPDHTMTDLDRRTVLRIGAAAVATSAGCLADGADDDDQYTEWIPADSNGILTAHVDLEISESTSGGGDLLPLILPSQDDAADAAYVPQISGPDGIDDPLLTVPIGLSGRVLVATIGLYVAGLGYLVDLETPEGNASDLVFVNGVVAVTGDLDVERARDRLTSGTEGPAFQEPFEPTGEYAGYDLYVPATDANEAVVAIDGSAALMADTRAELEPVIDAARGDVGRAIETRDRFGWLVDEAGGGHLTVGWVGGIDLEQFFVGDAEEQLPTEFLRRYDALFTSITLDPESDEVTAELAAGGIDDEAARDRLTDRIGTATNDLNTSVDGERMSATGTYGSDVLDVEFREREGGEEGTEVPEVDPPQAVAEAVPEDAFRFEYMESENRVDVHIEESFEAEELTVWTVESEWESTVSPIGSVNRLTVYVDPDGDTVVVSVTVDGESGVVAVREFP